MAWTKEQRKANQEHLRDYLRDYIARRKAEFFQGRSCERCETPYTGPGSLQLDHIDPSTKLSSRFWGWSRERREAELAKCQVLCPPCHRAKTREGGDHSGGRLVEEDVREIKRRLRRGESQTSIADSFGVTPSAISYISTGKHWADV